MNACAFNYLSIVSYTLPRVRITSDNITRLIHFECYTLTSRQRTIGYRYISVKLLCFVILSVVKSAIRIKSNIIESCIYYRSAHWERDACPRSIRPSWSPSSQSPELASSSFPTEWSLDRIHTRIPRTLDGRMNGHTHTHTEGRLRWHVWQNVMHLNQWSHTDFSLWFIPMIYVVSMARKLAGWTP